ncbi:MAG TPA: hypothetical protein VGB07_36380 [Blastocatellia bacterium]
MLEKEREVYSQNFSEWLTQHSDKFVVIIGEEVIGFYNTIEEALSMGAQRVGLNPFLVREIKQTPTEVYIPALSLGILNANSSLPA